MNKRQQRALVNLLALGGIVAVFVHTRKRMSRAHIGGGMQPSPPAPVVPASGVYVTIPPGFRRATDAEVSPGMRDAARDHLRAPLGSLLGPLRDEAGREFLVAIETHSNAPKGASIVVRA